MMRRPITINGETKSMAGWAKEVGISCEAMRLRVNHYGEDAGEVLIKPKYVYNPMNPSGNKKDSKYRRILGYDTVELADKMSITQAGIYKAIQKHMELLEEDLQNDRWLDAEACAFLTGKKALWGEHTTPCLLCPLFSRGWCLQDADNQYRSDAKVMDVFNEVKESM